MQGTLHITDRDYCYFAVWSPTEFHYERVERNTTVWREMFPQLLECYHTHILEGRGAEPDLGEEEQEAGRQAVLASLACTPARAAAIEEETRGQAENMEWKVQRSKRLTASNFGRVGKMRRSTSCQSTVTGLLYPASLADLTALEWGRQNEPAALVQLARLLNTEIRPCGLFVEAGRGLLAASPDGLVGEDAVVEVKCPSRCQDRPIRAVAESDSSFCLEINRHTGRLGLRRGHHYYYQVQGQMALTGRARCHFLVWSPEEHFLETVEFDPEFWAGLQVKLNSFYLDCLLPELADPRAPRGRPVRDLRG